MNELLREFDRIYNRRRRTNVMTVLLAAAVMLAFCVYVSIAAKAEQMPVPATEPIEETKDYLLWTPDGSYWIENGYVAGREGDPKNITDTIYGIERGREIYDPESDGWYWLDTCYNGRVATHKEVWFPYVYSFETPGETNGKWVRYDSSGKMVKGFCFVQGEESKNDPDIALYYYDEITGAMMKGNITFYDDYENEHVETTIYFDRMTGKAEITPRLFEMLEALHTDKWTVQIFREDEIATMTRFIEMWKEYAEN